MTIRVSASQINLFLNEPALWVLNKFHKVYGEMGPAAWRGTAVEKGLEAILRNGMTQDLALEWAYKTFDESASVYTGEDKDKERDLIAPMLIQALSLFSELELPEQYQVEIRGEIEGVEVLGYADFEFSDHFIDLKTTKRCPSSADNISPEHMRQLAIYKMLTNKTQKIAYVTDKKFALYEPEDFYAAEREIRSAIKAMKTAWEMDTVVVQTLYPPRSFGSFYWDNTTINAAKEIWR